MNQSQKVGAKYPRNQFQEQLLKIIHQIKIIDSQQMFRFQYLHYTIERLIQDPIQHDYEVMFFISMEGDKAIMINKHHNMDKKAKIQGDRLNLQHLIPQNFDYIQFTANEKLVKILHYKIVDKLKKINVHSIQQIQLRCMANIYIQLEDFQADIYNLIAWNQLFRANHYFSFSYITYLHCQIRKILQDAGLRQKLLQLKKAYLSSLAVIEKNYKKSEMFWPSIPTKFKQYEQITRYHPNPIDRTPEIIQRRRSQKIPIQCQSNCSCLSQTDSITNPYLTFDIKTGWHSSCPNKQNNIQCDHKIQSEQKLCKNCPIKKEERMKCAKIDQKNEAQLQLEEHLSWGLDFYTRNFIYNCLPSFRIINKLTKIFNQSQKNNFIQKTLQIAASKLNDKGYDIMEILQFIIITIRSQNNSPTDKRYYHFTDQDDLYANAIRKCFKLLNDKQCLRFHTKGKGVYCNNKKGIKLGSFIGEYFGQIYQPWRWYDKEDAIKQILKKNNIKNYLPEFYNIYMQKHKNEPLGYDILIIDPISKGNFTSRLSHSCNPNCGTISTVSNGMYYIGMYCFKDIQYGQELTFDYCSTTESTYQHFNSICLCGMEKCRGYYLQLVHKQDFNEYMNEENCFLKKNVSLLNNCKGEVSQLQYQKCYDNNIKYSLLAYTPKWLIKWLSKTLDFMDQEAQTFRKYLLLNNHKNEIWKNKSQAQKQTNLQFLAQLRIEQFRTGRYQNLIISLDKLKYFYHKNMNTQKPPIYLQTDRHIYTLLVSSEDSLLNELKKVFQYLLQYDLIHQMNHYHQLMKLQTSYTLKLSIFRMALLLLSQELRLISHQYRHKYNIDLLADILYFYAFTHTYFTIHQYKAFQSQPITISQNQFSWEFKKNTKNQIQKKYQSSFAWSQVLEWYHQTFANPSVTFKHDKRGILQYPVIHSILKSQYPFSKNRKEYLKMLRQRPNSCWPNSKTCILSFKNTNNLFGTIFFEDIYNKQKFDNKLLKTTLIESVLYSIQSQSLLQKLQLFKEGIEKSSHIYNFPKANTRLHIYKNINAQLLKQQDKYLYEKQNHMIPVKKFKFNEMTPIV